VVGGGAVRFWSSRAVRQAKRAYDLAVLEGLIAENEARLAEIEAKRNAPCRQCALMDGATS
jgi:hypothetical protein